MGCFQNNNGGLNNDSHSGNVAERNRDEDATDDGDDEQLEQIYAAENTDDIANIANNSCYIGLPTLDNESGHYLYSLHVRAETFFQYNHEDVDNYLRTYSCVKIPDEQPVEIMKTHFAFEEIGGEQVYIARVVLKTCWLRIFQRKWRRSRQYVNMT
jgi:hypothetical protein